MNGKRKQLFFTANERASVHRAVCTVHRTNLQFKLIAEREVHEIDTEMSGLCV